MIKDVEMTIEEAIKWQEAFKRIYGNLPPATEACDMAIEALKEPEGKWIPVTERLPEVTQNEYYPLSLVTLDNRDVCLGVYHYDDEEWWTRMSEGETVYTTDHKVVAWRPLPEPYRAGEQE